MNIQDVPVIKVENLHLTYNAATSSELHVLRGISFEVHRGEVICIIGPSGTGKSSLIRCLNGLAIPQEGNVIITDIRLSQDSVREIRQKTGFVFQHFELFPHMSVLENVSLPLRRAKGVPFPEAKEKAIHALAKVGLGDKINASPANLSGGQKQRVAIARALAQDPEIILFDEPTSALDPELIGEVLTIMEEIAKEGMTMMVVTHEIDFAMNVADRVFFMDEGLIYEEAHPKVMFSNPKKERTKKFLEASHIMADSIKNDLSSGKTLIRQHEDKDGNIIHVRNLHLTYNRHGKDEVNVLKGIDFTVKRGEVICIIGPSGTGKSSLIRCLNGLTKPTWGDVIINGENIYNPKSEYYHNMHLLRKKIGFVFQHFELFPHMSVIKNVMLNAWKSEGMGEEEARQRAMTALEKVGLVDKAKESPSNLSGGQKQRVAIARALAQDPEIILFDEPTSALDPELIGEVLTIMEEIAKEGMTMIVVTHEINFAMSVANRIFFMDNGKIWEQGSPEDLFRNPKMERTWDFLKASKLLKEKTKPTKFKQPEYTPKQLAKKDPQLEQLLNQKERFEVAEDRSSAAMYLGVLAVIPFMLYMLTGPIAIIVGFLALRTKPRSPQAQFKARFGLISGVFQVVAFITLYLILGNLGILDFTII